MNAIKLSSLKVRKKQAFQNSICSNYAFDLQVCGWKIGRKLEKTQKPANKIHAEKAVKLAVECCPSCDVSQALKLHNEPRKINKYLLSGKTIRQ
jgi:hypothetical protein